MGLSKQPYKGTRDFFPPQKRIQDYLFEAMKKTAHQFGYEHYDGPLLEEVDLYKAKSGQELIQNQIYSFYDRGERHVAIRPEMTPTLARMVAQIYRETTRPIRWYSIPNLMRYERPQKGRLREHWQFNVDLFGATGKLGEVEILQVLVQLMKNFGANKDQFEILVNDRLIVDFVFQKLLGLDHEKSYALYKVIDMAKKLKPNELEEEMRKIISEKQTPIFQEYLALKSFEDCLSFLKHHGALDELASLTEFLNLLQSLNLHSYIVYDPTIVRGLDYYTGIVFEVFDKNPENRRAICGGGAYANLLKIFDEEPLPGVGFGLGDVTLTDFLITHKLMPDLSFPVNDLFVTFQDDKALAPALTWANSLREKNLNVVTTFTPTKFNKAFPLAEKKGARFISFIGENELQTQTVQIKDMKTKAQTIVSLNDIDLAVKTISSKVSP